MTENKRFIIIDEGFDFLIRDTFTNDEFIDVEGVCDVLNDYEKENGQLKQSIQEYKAILQDMGILMSDEDVVNIRNDIADKLFKPLFKSNGFDVDIDTTDGFTIIPKGDAE